MGYVSKELGLPEPITAFDEWLESVISRGSNDEDYPVQQLYLFFKSYFQTAACGRVVLDTQVAARLSNQLRGFGALDEPVVRKYVEHWKKTGYLG